jgi:hypothetical protein
MVRSSSFSAVIRLRAKAIFVRCWLRGDRGAVAILFALCGSMMVGAICIALDSIVEAMTMSRTQSASDVATLSIGNDISHFPTVTGANLTQLQADALNYYNANMTSAGDSASLKAANFVLSITGTAATGQTISLAIKSTYTLPFALSLGSNTSTTGTSSGSSNTSSGTTATTTTVTANSTVTRIPNSTLEMVMVFDNTGSMNDSINGVTKIAGLKTAANTLVNLVMGQSSGTSYVGLVPFTTTVNVSGSLLPSGSWLNPVFTYNKTNVSMSAWSGCTAEPRDVNNYLYPLPYSPKDALKFTPYYFNVPPGGMKVNTYAQQQYTFSFSSGWTLTGGMCSTPPASTKTILGVPVSTNAGNVNYCGYSGNQVGNGIAFSFDQSLSGSGSAQSATQNSDCITNPVTFLTTNQTTVTNAIKAMNAGGSTIIPTGIMWGWRMLTSSWSNAIAGSGNGWVSSNPNLPLPETTAALQRVMVILTDGENDVGVANLIPNDLYFNGLSGVGTNSLAAPTVLHSATNKPMTDGRMDSSETVALATNGVGDPTDIDDFQIAACTAIKNSGITIYTITYGSVSDVAAATMKSCSSPGNYYAAPNAATLNTVFQQIAGNLGILRLTQ